MRQVSALLPMKGHSERVPNKNLRDFNGRPLFFWMLDSLMSVQQVGEIIVDTDSDNIAAEVTKYCGSVRIVDRPKGLCGDSVPMNRIIEHDLAFARFDHVLQTHSTNPLLSSATIHAALADYFECLDDYDSIFSVTRLQARLYSGDGVAINHNPSELLRTQDLPPLFEENSCLYIFSKSSFAITANRIGRTPKMFEVGRYEAVDIDEPYDFEVARLLHQMKGKL